MSSSWADSVSPSWVTTVQKLCDEGGFRIRFYSDGELWERWDRELVPLLLEVAKAAEHLARESENGGVAAVNGVEHWEPLDAALAALDGWAQKREDA